MSLAKNKIDQSKKLFTGPLALFSNLMTTAGKANWTVPKLGFVGDSFSIILVANVNNEATIFAQGSTFSIQPEGTVNKDASPAVQATGSYNAGARAEWSVGVQAAVVIEAMLLLIMYP
ncbi:hypothetical protein BGZ54_000003 [Gamsiella multidivaricata]|nr:hypothetical protein BGZ54_000003 [Gamsiella multidivaricata]